MRSLLLALTVLGAPAIAASDPLEALLDIYAVQAGQLEACGRGPGIEALDAPAQAIAGHALPGLWSRVNGDRGVLAERLVRLARLTYLTKASAPCAIIPTLLPTHELILDEALGAIQRATD